MLPVVVSPLWVPGCVLEGWAGWKKGPVGVQGARGAPTVEKPLEGAAGCTSRRETEPGWSPDPATSAWPEGLRGRAGGLPGTGLACEAAFPARSRRARDSPSWPPAIPCWK